MSARDVFHDAVKIALQKEGWHITHDPLSLEFGLGLLYVDLSAERIIAAERSNEKIAVEINRTYALALHSSPALKPCDKSRAKS